MKKIFMLVAILCLILITSGCKKKTLLYCSTDTNNAKLEYNIVFKDDYIDSMKLSYIMDISKFTDNQKVALAKENYCKLLKKSMVQYDEAFSNCKQDINNDNMFVVNIDLEVEKIEKNLLSKMVSVDKTKEVLENGGYKCEIK